MIADIQFNPTTTPWPVIRDAARVAESTGYGAVLVFDHLAGSSLGGTTNLEMFTLLGALAASTERIALGSLVANVHNRQPALLAVGAASVETIGDDRQVFLGIGAGTSPTSRFADEQHAVGHHVEPELAIRHRTVADVIGRCRAIWSPDRPAELSTFALPRVLPEIHVGVNSVALAHLAGTIADGVNVAWPSPRRGELLAAAADARLAAHGSLDGFTRTAWAFFDDALLDAASPERVEMAAAGLDRLILVAPVDVARRLAS